MALQRKQQVASGQEWLHASAMSRQFACGQLGSFEPAFFKKQLPNLLQILVTRFGGSIARAAAPQVLVVQCDSLMNYAAKEHTTDATIAEGKRFVPHQKIGRAGQQE